MDGIDELCSRWWRQQNAGGLNYLRIFAVLNGQIERNRKRNTVHGFMLFFYSLGIWSAWFLQRRGAEEDGHHALADLDMDFSGGDS